MSFLHDLANLVQHKEATRNLNSGGHGRITHAPVDAQQRAVLNAKIAADGARMYEEAHPGKVYVPGQNGETYDGGIDQVAYQQYMHPKALAATLPAKRLASPMQSTQRLQVQPYNSTGHNMEVQGLARNDPQGLVPRQSGGAFNAVNPVDEDSLQYLQQLQPQRSSIQRARIF